MIKLSWSRSRFNDHLLILDSESSQSTALPTITSLEATTTPSSATDPGGDVELNATQLAVTMAATSTESDIILSDVTMNTNTIITGN